jgi:oxalate decarboxylase
VTFSTSLDKSPIKATSGGWARDITSKSLPVATSIAGAHLYLNPGGVREMHWHNSAEWAYILTGHCQVTVVDPQGETEVANYAAGDLWYFPKAHAHAIQTLGTEPCHAILAFDDGLYADHGTFGLIPSTLSLDLRDPGVGAKRFDAAGLRDEAPPSLAGGIDDSLVVVMQPVRKRSLR